jgi:putative DNA primase/helicase
MTNAELDALVIELDAHRPPAFSDEAIALRFAERHAADLRYVAAWSRWLVWDGQSTLRAFDRARKICRETAAECNKGKIASAIASAKTVAAIERLAKSDRRLAAVVEQWDCDRYQFNDPTE